MRMGNFPFVYFAYFAVHLPKVLLQKRKKSDNFFFPSGGRES